MKYIDLSCDLQEADNGNTTYYGGTFTARPSSAQPGDSCEFYFTGSDRESSPLEQIASHMFDWYGIDCPDGWEVKDSKFTEVLEEAIHFSRTIRLFLDDKLIVTMIEPIR